MPQRLREFVQCSSRRWNHSLVIKLCPHSMRRQLLCHSGASNFLKCATIHLKCVIMDLKCLLMSLKWLLMRLKHSLIVQNLSPMRLKRQPMDLNCLPMHLNRLLMGLKRLLMDPNCLRMACTLDSIRLDSGMAGLRCARPGQSDKAAHHAALPGFRAVATFTRSALPFSTPPRENVAP